MKIVRQSDERALIRFFLNSAAQHHINVRELLSQWRMAHIVVRCDGAAELAHSSNAPAKIRGAWGRQLAEGASQAALAGGPCHWAAPCAYDLFFNAQGKTAARLEIPKPFVLSVDAEGTGLRVQLTLFGIAGDWAGEAADALVRALRHGLDMAGNRRQPLRVIDRHLEVSEGVEPLAHNTPLELDFVTPVAVRQGADAHVSPASMITSLANRVSGLALWHGSALEIDGRGLAAEATMIKTRAEWRVSDVRLWERGSQAQSRRIPMHGVVGKLILPPASELVTSLVCLGEYCHLGSRTTVGMGRYRLSARILKSMEQMGM